MNPKHPLKWHQIYCGRLIATTAILVPLWLAVPVKAANLEHLKQLLETKNCPGCDLSGANLTGSRLVKANLRGANLSGAKLGGSGVIAADLRAANLQGANLSGADLRGVILERSNLSEANLSNAVLVGAYLRFANLERANLRGANLSDADLRNAKLVNVNLNNSNLTGAIGLPAGAVPPKASERRGEEETSPTSGTRGGIQFNPPDIGPGGGRVPGGSR